MANSDFGDDHEPAASEFSSANRDLYGSNGGSDGLVACTSPRTHATLPRC